MFISVGFRVVKIGKGKFLENSVRCIPGVRSTSPLGLGRFFLGIKFWAIAKRQYVKQFTEIFCPWVRSKRPVFLYKESNADKGSHRLFEKARTNPAPAAPAQRS